MRTRNALMLVAASIFTAAVAGAQQPAKSAPTRSVTPPTASKPAAAKPSARTAAVAALPVNADSARKVVATNAAGATITSTHLRRSGDRAYYAVDYRMKGSRKTQHATVDARTGAFEKMMAPAKTSAHKPT